MQDFGSLIFISSEEGDLELGMETAMMRQLQAKGIPLDDITHFVVKKIVREEVEKIKTTLIDKGIPPQIKKLIDTNKKKDAIAIAKKITITKDELCCLIFNSKQIDFKHSRKHKYFLPSEVIHTDEEKEGLAQNGIGPIVNKAAKKFISKIAGHFNKRRVVSAHLFEKGDEWHLFYFDYNDAYLPKGPNHYCEGPHIHYVSYLWGNLQKETLWAMLDDRQFRAPSIHIKYIDKKEGSEH